MVIHYEYLLYTAAVLLVLLFLVSILQPCEKRGKIALIAAFSLSTCIGIYLLSLWITLERPPMRSSGETRLWYSFFLPLLGCVLFHNLRQRWIIYYGIFVSLVFLTINYCKPGIFDKTLMPALQSPWFIPHVLTYILGYALFSCSALMAGRNLYMKLTGRPISDNILAIRNTVRIGFSLITLGMLMGAIWAQKAWAHYWGWDPKEVWALITWLIYALFLHFDWRVSIQQQQTEKKWEGRHTVGMNIFLLAAFAAVLICWFGVNYLSSAADSIHTYRN